MAAQWVRQAQARGVSDEQALMLYRRALPVLPPGPMQRLAYRKLCFLQAVAEPREGLAVAGRGLAVARAAKDLVAEAVLVHCQGYAREVLGDKGEAARLYDEAVALATRAGDPGVLAEALTSRGQLGQEGGDYDDAITDLKRAYDLERNLHDASAAARTLNAMANFYADGNVGDYARAIGYYRELLARHERAGDRAEAATTAFNIGATLETAGRYGEAMPWYRRAYDIDKARGDAASVAEEQRVIGALLARQGKLDTALLWIDRALAYQREQRDADGIARNRLTRGIALRLGGQSERALTDLDAALDFFRPLRNERYLVRIQAERSLALAALGRWRAAYAAQGEQLQLQQALDHKVAAERISRLRVQFGVERTEDSNRLLQAEDRRRGEALEAATRERGLQRQVLGLADLLLAVLVVLAARQLRRARTLRLLALTDELTGLPNRRSVLALLEQQRARTRRTHKPFGVVLFDIDHFKRINDTHGHDGGDRALRRVAAVAAKSLRASDRLGRFGGEEFLMVLPDADLQVAVDIAERCRGAIAREIFDDVAPGQRISISLGVGAVATGDELVESLLKRVDEALYDAKTAGRNRVVAARVGEGSAPAPAASSGNR